MAGMHTVRAACSKTRMRYSVQFKQIRNLTAIWGPENVCHHFEVFTFEFVKLSQ